MMYQQPVQKRDRRCRYYQTDGRPQRGTQGCPRFAERCFYIHPEDPEWTQVLRLPRPRSRSPHRRRALSPSSNRSYSRGRSLSPRRGRSRSPRHYSSDHSRRKSSVPPRPAERRTPPPRSATGDSRTPRADPSRSPDRHSLSNWFESDTTISGSRPSHPDSNMSATRSRLPSGPRTLHGITSASSSVPQSPTTVHHAHVLPPPSSDTIGPMPPPPPPQRAAPSLALPSLPSGAYSVATPQRPTSKEVPLEQKRAVWEERVRLSANAINERIEFVKLGHEVAEQRRYIQSSRFTGLSDKDQKFATEQFTAAEAKLAETRKNINKLLGALAETGFWPIVPACNIEDFDAKFKDMKGSLGELHSAIQLLQSSLYDVTIQNLRRRGISIPEGARMVGDPDGMAESSRPSKRRRVGSSDGQGEGDDMQQAIENLTDRMAKLTHHVDELQNDFTQHNDNIIQEYSGVLEDKIDEIRGSLDPAALSAGPLSSAALEKLNENYDQAHSDLDEITKEVVEVYGRIHMLEEENARLQKENAQWKEMAETMSAKQKAQDELLENIKAETRALNAALTARLAEQPAAPPQPSLEVIVESLREPIIRAARQDSERLIAQNRASMETLMSRYQSQMQGPVRDKVLQSARMADLMLAWIQRRDPEGLEHVRRTIFKMQQGQLQPSPPSDQAIPEVHPQMPEIPVVSTHAPAPLPPPVTALSSSGLPLLQPNS